MFSPLGFERRLIPVMPEQAHAAALALQALGVSTRILADGTLTALIRLGWKGAQDRLAICQVEMRFTAGREELVQWVKMCWGLPVGTELPLQPDLNSPLGTVEL